MNDHIPTPQFIKLSVRANDITGQRFGRLVALGPIGHTRHGRAVWLCQCDCGNMTSVEGAVLRRPKGTRSCGCLFQEIVKSVNRTHGMIKHPAYTSWLGMRERCLNPNNHKYPSYGGRGIEVYQPWIESFEAFLAHVSTLPHFGKKGYSIDRVDNEGNYEPGNVRWATVATQNRNTRQNVMLTHGGITLCAEEWARILGMHGKTLRRRIACGWSVERALTEPVRRSLK